MRKEGRKEGRNDRISRKGGYQGKKVISEERKKGRKEMYRSQVSSRFGIGSLGIES